VETVLKIQEETVLKEIKTGSGMIEDEIDLL